MRYRTLTMFALVQLMVSPRELSIYRHFRYLRKHVDICTSNMHYGWENNWRILRIGDPLSLSQGKSLVCASNVHRLSYLVLYGYQG